MTHETSHQIINVGQILYCPICGEKAEREKPPEAGYKTKDIEVTCPNHGELWM